MNLIVCLRQNPCGRFSASVPCFGGVFSYGDTVADALHNITDAIELSMEDMLVDLENDSQLIFPELPEDFRIDSEGDEAEHNQAVLHNFVELTKEVRKKLKLGNRANSSGSGLPSDSTTSNMNFYEEVKVLA